MNIKKYHAKSEMIGGHKIMSFNYVVDIFKNILQKSINLKNVYDIFCKNIYYNDAYVFYKNALDYYKNYQNAKHMEIFHIF
jgi:hypothetical protein